MNTTNIGEVFARTRKLLRTGLDTKEQIAKKLNSEFHVAAYVGSGKLFCKYMDHQERPNTVELV